MTYNCFASGSDEKYIHITENKPIKHKSGLKTFLLILSVVAAIKYYDATRPIIKGEILGSNFSTNTPSEIYVRNEKTNSIDTLFLETENNGLRIVAGNPENFNGRTKELKEKMTPGSLLEVKLYRSNHDFKRIYRINEVQQAPRRTGTDYLSGF